ncbi:MAG: Cof-type HAD-IIB family hydrolase [Ruminococcus sp.]|nr:Cof-type HAD-IIB family hydrolase [Ruminococcus sp.]
MFQDISKVLLITDMDGTFLPASKIPSPKDLEAIKRFQEAGGKFSIATGRAIQASQQYFNDFKVNAPIIMCNGGMVYDLINHKQIYDVYLPDKAKTFTEQILKDNPDVGCEVLKLDGVYVPSYTEMEKIHCDICKVSPILCQVNDIKNNWYKVLFTNVPEKLPKLIDYINKHNFDDVDFVISAPQYFEMLPQNISKGSALKKMRDICGFEDYTFVAVGDYNNDIEMIKYADVGICPLNATEDVKNVADIVLDVTCEQNAISAVIDFIFEKVSCN